MLTRLRIDENEATPHSRSVSRPSEGAAPVMGYAPGPAQHPVTKALRSTLALSCRCRYALTPAVAHSCTVPEATASTPSTPS